MNDALMVVLSVAAVLAIAVATYKLSTWGKPAPPREERAASDVLVTPMTFWRTVLAVIVGMAVYSAVAWLLYLITH